MSPVPQPGRTEDFPLVVVSRERQPSSSSLQDPETLTQSSQHPHLPVSIENEDGGYGWVILASCSILSFFLVGLGYAWGLIQTRLVAANLGSTSTIAFIGSLTVSFVSFGAIINARILRLIGARKSATLACLLIGIGQILSGWTTESVPGLFITNGLVMGFGIGLCFMVCGSLPGQYFSRRRGLANGVVIGSGGIGGCVISVSLDALLSRVGVAWTFRIMGLITLAATLPAALLLKDKVRRVPGAIEWSLFRDPKFSLLFIGSGIAAFPILVPPFFIPLYAGSLSISNSTASLLLASFNLSSAFGRLGFGYLCDVIGPLNSLCLSILVSAVSMLTIWPASTSLAPLVIFIIVCGVGNGGFFSTMPSVVGHLYGPTRVSIALAMIVSAWAGGYVMGAPVAGWILERYGGSEAGRTAFRPAMYYAGSMSLGSASFAIGARSLMTRKLFTFA